MIVTLDFETYYDDEYTLKKMSTSEYIRDPRFQVINVAIKIGDAVPYVVWGHKEAGKALRGIDWSKYEGLAHHMHFEGLILSHHFQVEPRAYRDTLSMGRAVFPKTERNDLGSLAARVGAANKLEMPDFKGKRAADLTQDERVAIEAYVVGDVESCAQIYAALVSRLPARELDVIDVTIRMFAQPVLRLDMKAARAELKRQQDNKAAAIAKASIDPKNLTKNKPFAAALQALGVFPPTKKSKTTGLDIYAFSQTDVEFTAMANHADPLVAALVEARLAAKSTIGETRAARLIKAGMRPKRLPVYLNYCGAHTLRWSGGDKLNFQNFPRSGELRRCITAPPGQVIVVVDSRQMHPRILAWLGGETWMLDSFVSGTDLYAIFGEKIYGRPIDKDRDKEMRQVAKVCCLALQFGMGAFRLQQTLAWGLMSPPIHLPLEVCQGYVNTYRQTNRCITGFWDTMTDAIGDMAKGRSGGFKCLQWDKDRVILPDGMVLHYPDTHALVVERRMGAMFGNRTEERVMDGSYMSPRGRSKLYGGLFTENVVQALERVVIAQQMLMIAERYRVVMSSHDEIAFLAPAKRAKEAMEFGMGVIRTRPSWGLDLPLDAEGGSAKNYSK